MAGVEGLETREQFGGPRLRLCVENRDAQANARAAIAHQTRRLVEVAGKLA